MAPCQKVWPFHLESCFTPTLLGPTKGLSTQGDTNLATIFFHRTPATDRRDGATKILSKGDEEIVVLDPIRFGELIPQRKFCLLRILGANITPAIGNSMHMRVYANARLAIAQCYDQIGGLSAYAFKFQQLVNLIGNSARMVADQNAANLADRFRLGAVEANGEDRSFDGFGREFYHLLRSVGQGKQAMRRSRSCGVLRPETQQAGNQNPKRVPVGFRHQCHNRSLPLGNFAPQDAHGSVDFVVFHGSGLFGLNWVN